MLTGLACCMLDTGLRRALSLMSLPLGFKGIDVQKRINYGGMWVLFWHVLAWRYGWNINEEFSRT